MALGRVLSLRLRATATVCALLVVFAAALPSAAHAQSTRTLKLHFTHTGERGTFTYRRGGQYDRKELDRINHILRDWRRDEPTRMDPALLDLLWEIHRRTGSNNYIHIISAYRSPSTNEMLRRRSSGVAKNSQHTRGKAIDFFIPGVPLSKLRAIALTAQGGGVGYYPGSGSPFVHVDTGSVRHWPRMTRQQLVSLFPKGETLHIPTDGKPLPGYETAKAKQRSGRSIAVASASGASEQASMSGWLKRVFSRGSDGDGGRTRERPAAASQPTTVARASEPRQPEPPRVTPAPRPAEAVGTEVAADEAEIAVAASEADADRPPVPRAMPEKTRALLMAARDRARLARMASADSGSAPEPARAPELGSAPQARPAAPVAVAALGNRPEGDEVNPASADAALAGLYATAGGGNPEAGAARLMNAAAALPEPAAVSDAGGGAEPPEVSDVALALLGTTGIPNISGPAGGERSGTALAAANALGGLGRVDGEADRSLPKVELAYASANVPAAGAAEPPSQNSPQRASSEPERAARALAEPMALVAIRVDRPLLRRLMSQDTTRTGSFGHLERPQPASDLYVASARGASSLHELGQLRTDRFQFR